MTRSDCNIRSFTLLGLGVTLMLMLGLCAEKGLADPISVEDVPPLPVSEGSSADLRGFTSPNFLNQGGLFTEPIEIEADYEIIEDSYLLMEMTGDYYVITTEKLNLTLDNIGSQQGDYSRTTRRFPFTMF